MKVSLRHIVPSEDERECTALENVAALAATPNGWMTKNQRERCKRFSGTEAEAEAMLISLEEYCTKQLSEWRKHQ
jgi:hypothetical protein